MKDLSESRVLIVDDVKANVDLLVHALRDDYQISVALNGADALRSVERNPPDLLLLDIVMPGIDGYEVCRRLRSDVKTCELPIMFLSSLEDVCDKTRGFEVGGNDYLTKPFEILEVKARVRSMLKAKAYSDGAKERSAAELGIAREIQMGLLPADGAALVQKCRLDIAALLEPAKEIGGDFYDVIPLDDGRVLVVVGDVSGKGIPAALFMAVTMTLIRSAARQFTALDQMVRHVNAALYAHNPRGMFVTLFCSIIDTAKMTLCCANAGHPSPVLLRAGETPSFPFDSTSTPIGVFETVDTDARWVDLHSGDGVVIYSDGVTEAFSDTGVMFAKEGLIASLATAAGENAAVHSAARPDARFRPRRGLASWPPPVQGDAIRVRGHGDIAYSRCRVCVGASSHLPRSRAAVWKTCRWSDPAPCRWPQHCHRTT
jgi:sigma-B regulation protein RsbU (phosphoserine phosphatase)